MGKFKTDLDTRARVLAEALPYIQDFHGEKIVIKFGGSIMENSDLKQSVAEDIVLLQYIGLKPLVVHGGGKAIGSTLKKMGIDSRFIEGQRVTDAETMEVVEMVLAGRVNKDIVEKINRAGARAIGLSGKDGQMLQAVPLKNCSKVEVDLGQVGEVEKVNPLPLELLEENYYVPVIAPIGVDRSGVTYNMNADYVAGSLAASLTARRLIFLTDVPGIIADGELLSSLDASGVEDLISREIIAGGMVPKATAGCQALEGGVEKTHIIDGSRPHSLLLELLTDQGIGTQIVDESRTYER